MSVGMLCVRHDPASAAVVRHTIADELSACAVSPDSVDDVVLVVSELVGNATVHADDADDVGVAWDIDGDCVIVRVDDGSDGAVATEAPSPDSPHGRGLAIVAALSAEWGVARAGHGKQVWARVPVRIAS